MRDLKRDMEICNNASPGPIDAAYDDLSLCAVVGNKSGVFAICIGPNKKANAEFIAAARTGWPEAIQRALGAEAELAVANAALEKLKTENERLQEVIEKSWQDLTLAESDIAYMHEAKERLSKALGGANNDPA